MTWRVDKSLLEMYQLFVSTDFEDNLKMHFGELKILFFLTAPNELVWYIRNFFEGFEDSKCLFHLKYELHSCSFYLFQKLSPPKFPPTYSSLVGRKHVWCLKYKHVLILRTWGADKTLVEIYPLFVSADFGGVQKMHFGELKMRFLPNAPFRLVWYIRNVF
jgi:hypothetical protein